MSSLIIETRTDQEDARMQLDYRNKNRPRGCEDCTEFPCLTHDGMRTWNCGKCDEKKKPGGEGVEELQVQA